MSNMYILLKKLCEDKGCTGYRMSKDCGASANLMTELKSGRKKTVSAELAAKLAEYFSVPVEYILGLTPEAQMIELEAELSEVSSKLDSNPDNFELQSRYDVLKEQIEDLKISMGLIGAKKDPSAMTDEEADEEKNSSAHEDAELDADTLLILDLLGKLTPSNLDRAIAYLQGLVAGQS